VKEEDKTSPPKARLVGSFRALYLDRVAYQAPVCVYVELDHYMIIVEETALGVIYVGDPLET
jgi:hypothetical protein